MEAVERREAILAYLKNNTEAVVARKLASEFEVSRQVIVGDIALLRAAGEAIHSTPKGYKMNSLIKEGVRKQFVCMHTPDETKEELYTVVDNGGEVVDVTVEHPIYGLMRGELNISNRLEADEFLDKISKQESLLLSTLTEGIHTHTIRAKNHHYLNKIGKGLKKKGLLYD